MRRPCERDRGRELPAGRSAGVGRRRRRRPGHPGLRHRHQRQPRRHGRLQDQHRRDRLPPRHLPHGLLRRPRRAQGRDGARRRRALPQNQPACLDRRRDRPHRLRQLGGRRRRGRCRRARVSGIYFAKLVREDGARARATSSSSCATTRGGSALLFQTSDTTWQAYNQYGGNSLYVGVARRPRLQGELQPPVHDARPDARGLGLQRRVPDGPLARGQRLRRQLHHRRRHRPPRRRAPRAPRSSCRSATTSTGPATQRANVEAARDAGVNLAFFSGNEIFWKTRWENSIDGSGTPYRTLVTYKETHANAKIDPLPDVWTGTWRDPRFSPPADGGRPENALTGTIFTVNCCSRRRSPCRRPTARCASGATPRVATLGAGQTATLAPRRSATSGTRTSTTASRPPGLVRLSTHDRQRAPQRLLDFGSTYGAGHGDASPDAVRRHASGALVFGAGTVQWSWGLDANHDRGGDAARRPHAAGDGQPVRRHGRAAGDAAGRAWSRPRRRPTRRRRPRRSPLRAERSPSASGVRPSRSPARRPTPAAASSAASRSRSTAAPPGIPPAAAAPGATPGSSRAVRLGHACAAARSTTAATSGAPGTGGHGHHRAAFPTERTVPAARSSWSPRAQQIRSAATTPRSCAPKGSTSSRSPTSRR